MKIRDLVAWGRKEVGDLREVYWIISGELGVPLQEVYLLDEIGDKEEERVRRAINLRERGIPLSYIMGVVEFCGLEFSVREGVFTPRRDTETLVEFAREVLPGKKERVLDLCCGVGNIGLSLSCLSGVDVVGVDILPRSIELSSQNAVRLGVRERAEFIREDIFSYLKRVQDKFSLIVSNPPYIPAEERHLLPPEVISEPEVCWNGGEGGMEFYPGIISEGIEKISAPGYIILEVGEKQAEEVRTLLEEAGLQETGIKRDAGQRERVVWGKKT